MSLGVGAGGVRVLSSQMIAIELPNHTMQQHATRPPKVSRVLLLLCVMRCGARVGSRSRRRVLPLLCPKSHEPNLPSILTRLTCCRSLCRGDVHSLHPQLCLDDPLNQGPR